MELPALVAEGSRNSDIAERLFLSQKTVSHHVSAILGKLDVTTAARQAPPTSELTRAKGRAHE